MPDDLKRVQVTMSKALRDLLRDWAAEISKARDEEIGTGTIAAELLEELAQHPDLIHSFLFEGVARESTTEYNASPKKGHARRSKAA